MEKLAARAYHSFCGEEKFCNLGHACEKSERSFEAWIMLTRPGGDSSVWISCLCGEATRATGPSHCESLNYSPQTRAQQNNNRSLSSSLSLSRTAQRRTRRNVWEYWSSKISMCAYSSAGRYVGRWSWSASLLSLHPCLYVDDLFNARAFPSLRHLRPL